MNIKKLNSVDEYISRQPLEVHEKLLKLRDVIKLVNTNITKKISYQMPSFQLFGNLVYFGSFKDHISFFPTSSGIEYFKKQLKNFKISKGTIQFKLSEEIPYDLIKKIVEFRVEENIQKELVRKQVK